MKILVIEDNEKIAKEIKRNLEHDLFVVDIACDGEIGSFLARTNEYDIVILDNVLPKKDGGTVLAEIRRDGKSVPILILSVKFETSLKVELLNLGADDYMQKPYSYSELVARIKVLLRRPQKVVSNSYKIGALEININSHTVKYLKKSVKLTRKEFLFISYLAKNKEQVVSRGELIEHVWDINADMFSNTIEATLLRIRKKFKLVGKKNIIETISGVGYKII